MGESSRAQIKMRSPLCRYTQIKNMEEGEEEEEVKEEEGEEAKEEAGGEATIRGKVIGPLVSNVETWGKTCWARRGQLLATLICNIGSVSLGTGLAWTAPALPQLAMQDGISLGEPGITLEEQEQVAAILNLGGCFASFGLAAKLIKDYGEKVRQQTNNQTVNKNNQPIKKQTSNHTTTTNNNNNSSSSTNNNNTSYNEGRGLQVCWHSSSQ